MQNNTTMKPMDRKCATCKNVLPKSMFYPNPAKKDGLFSTCKDCCNVKRRKKNPIVHPEGTKECFKCKEQKPYEQFHINKSKADGYNYQCKSCEYNIRVKYKKVKEIDYSSFYLPIQCLI